MVGGGGGGEHAHTRKQVKQPFLSDIVETV